MIVVFSYSGDTVKTIINPIRSKENENDHPTINRLFICE